MIAEIPLPDPYVFIRAITLGLGFIWSVGTCVRTWQFAGRWSTRLVEFGLSEEWIRRQAIQFTLRATICDPINLALMLTLVGLWGVRGLLT